VGYRLPSQLDLPARLSTKIVAVFLKAQAPAVVLGRADAGLLLQHVLFRQDSQGRLCRSCLWWQILLLLLLLPIPQLRVAGADDGAILRTIMAMGRSVCETCAATRPMF